MDNTNELLYQVLVESNADIPEGMKDFVFERFIDDNSPSVVLNEYLSKLESCVDSLRRLYYRNASNRNGAVEEALDLMSEIERETTLAREKMKISPPEDVNEDSSLDGFIPKEVIIQIGDERIQVKNSQVKTFERDGNKIVLLKVSPNYSRNIRNAHVKPLFLIDSYIYALDSEVDEGFRLKQMKHQHNAFDVFLSLNNPDRYDASLKRLDRIS